MNNNGDEAWILGLSTSHGVAEVAAMTATGKILFEFDIQEYKSQSAQLLPKLNDALINANRLGNEASAVAVNVGPGGFTSLRTACGVTQGLCIAWGLPCVTASSFECMVGDWQAQGGTIKQSGVLCLVDARLQSLYGGLANFSEQGCLGEFSASIFADSGADLPSVENLLVLADQSVTKQLSVTPQHMGFARPSAVGLCSVAWAKFAEHGGQAAEEAQPFYLREKVAQTTAERLRARHA